MNNTNNLKFNNDQVYKILQIKTNQANKHELIEKLAITNKLTKDILKPLFEGKINNNDILENINPLHWEFGHIVYFWIENTIKILKYPIGKNLKNEYIYDSFKTDRETRFNSLNEIDSIDTITKYYDSAILNTIINLTQLQSFQNKVEPVTSYLINLSLLHNHMHLESFCFSLQSLKLSKPISENLFNPIIQSKVDCENPFIEIKGGAFVQGWNDTNNNFTFDNEKPSFQIHVNDFSVSKYPITQGQFIKFIHSGGYNDKKFWCHEGWRWKIKNNIILPLYWEFIGSVGKIMKLKWGVFETIHYNEPMCNISWYEANAYCRWANCRLPTETEWEYLATNGGQTLFPWGDNLPNNEHANLNYYYDGPMPVNNYEVGNNKDGVQQLFGNVWEWCQEPIYPYNGFEIDPVYREMSYPFFGFKRICRGGSWCVPEYLINSKYRNAQSPDCRIQYIGFRVCI